MGAKEKVMHQVAFLRGNDAYTLRKLAEAVDVPGMKPLATELMKLAENIEYRASVLEDAIKEDD